MKVDRWIHIYSTKDALVSEEVDGVPAPQWIPVTERLPEKEGHYFVTDEAAGMAEALIDKYICCDDGEWVWLYSQNVTAWMELPAPYKEGQDG